MRTSTAIDVEFLMYGSNPVDLTRGQVVIILVVSLPLGSKVEPAGGVVFYLVYLLEKPLPSSNLFFSSVSRRSGENCVGPWFTQIVSRLPQSASFVFPSAITVATRSTAPVRRVTCAGFPSLCAALPSKARPYRSCASSRSPNAS